MQLITSLGADLFLGDIKGAFLESVDEKQENGPLFAHLPPRVFLASLLTPSL